MTAPPPSRFDVTPLENILGAGITTANSALLWGRSALEGPFRLELRARGDEQSFPALHIPLAADEDRTFTLDCARDLPGARPLRPSTPYVARLTARSGLLVGEAAFETAPASATEMPARVTFAALSCHQPFDEAGRVRANALEMLAAARRAFAIYDVKRAFFMGDQIYADAPAALSLFAPGRAADDPEALRRLPRAALRALYQQRHRIFWGVPGWRELQAACASTCALDDHEIVDDWGSHEEHGDAGWASLREAALDAFADYQGRRALPRRRARPASFHHAFVYGDVGVFVLDVRSARAPVAADRSDGEASRTPADAQMADLEGFLASCAGCRVVLLVVSVPLAHLPDAFTTAGTLLLGADSEFADRWSAPRHRATRDRLLALLARQKAARPEQRIVILSGDIHAGCAAVLRGRELPGIELYQLVSSAVTNDVAAGLRGRLARGAVSLLPLSAPAGLDASFVAGTGENPFFGLNVGLVELERRGRETTVCFRLISHEANEPVVVFDTGPL